MPGVSSIGLSNVWHLHSLLLTYSAYQRNMVQLRCELRVI